MFWSLYVRSPLFYLYFYTGADYKAHASEGAQRLGDVLDF